MKLVDREETVMVVVGGDGSNRDRPSAVALKEAIDARANGQAYRLAVVIGDAEFLDRPELHRHPTIAVGGPGVNAVSQRLVDALPMRWQHEERSFLQADLDDTNRVALWGMDADSTAAAVSAFMAEGYLEAMLDRIWRFRPGSMM
jgi:hypothetical protein